MPSSPRTEGTPYGATLLPSHGGIKYLSLTSAKASSKMTANVCSGAQIPVIDLSGDEEHVGNELLEAVMKWGFVFIHGEALGFSPQVIEDTFDLVTIDSRPYIK